MTLNEKIMLDASKRPNWDIVYFPLGSAAFGGAERSLLELAAAQHALGRRVLICYEPALENTDFIPQATARALPLKRVDWAPEKRLTDVGRAAWRFFRQDNTQLIHFNMSWRRHMWLIPLCARLFSRARLIATMRALPDDYDLIPRRRYFGFIPGLRLWILPDLIVGRVWAKTLHLTVSVNREDYPPRLTKEFGFPQERLRVVYNGVVIPEHVPDIQDRQANKARLGFEPRAFLVAYVGRISEEKGIRHAIDAVAACDPRVHLVVAGEGEQLETLKAYVEHLGLSSRIRFVGYVSDPFSIFSAADVALVPSLWNEAFGRVVVEAMACGTPVIATTVGGMRELFTDGKEGIYVTKADTQAISAAINQLLDDPVRLQEMARAARQLVELRYTTQRVVAEYSNLYAEALGQPVSQEKMEQQR